MALTSERSNAHQTRITKRIQETGAGEGHYQKVESMAKNLGLKCSLEKIHFEISAVDIQMILMWMGVQSDCLQQQ